MPNNEHTKITDQSLIGRALIALEHATKTIDEMSQHPSKVEYLELCAVRRVLLEANALLMRGLSTEISGVSFDFPLNVGYRPIDNCPESSLSFRTPVSSDDGSYNYATVYTDKFNPWELCMAVQYLTDNGLRLEDGDTYELIDKDETAEIVRAMNRLHIDSEYDESFVPDKDGDEDRY
jgi:hypothetical protein